MELSPSHNEGQLHKLAAKFHVTAFRIEYRHILDEVNSVIVAVPQQCHFVIAMDFLRKDRNDGSSALPYEFSLAIKESLRAGELILSLTDHMGRYQINPSYNVPLWRLKYVWLLALAELANKSLYDSI